MTIYKHLFCIDFGSFRPAGALSTDGQSSNADLEAAAELALDDDILWVLEAHAKLNAASPSKSPEREMLGRKSPSDWQQQFTSSQQLYENDRRSPPGVTSQRTSPQLVKERKQRVASSSKPSSSVEHRRSPPRISTSGRPPKSANAAVDSQKDQALILSKSMPLMPPLGGGSIAHSKGMLTIGSSSEKKGSVKGLTKGDFDNMSMHSPYLEHLKKGSPFAGLTNAFEIHKAIFAKKTKKNGSKPPKTKAYAVMSEEKNQFDRRQKSGMQRSLIPPSGTSSELKPFTPMTSKHIEIKPHSLRPDRQPEDLYMRSKMLFHQMEPSRSAARIVDGQGHVIRPLTGAAMTNDDEGHGSLMNTNTLSAFHSSTELILRTSPSNMMLNESKGINSIDHLVTTQQLPNGKLLRPIPRSPNTGINEFFIQQTKHHQQQQPPEPATPLLGSSFDAENRLDAMDMLANIHIDPLYRIIREEMDRIQALPAAASSSANPSQQPVSQRQHSEIIVPAHIKVLCYFQALPPAVWVTCRLVYFLLISYYETVLKRNEYEAFRQATGLEQLWSILEYHHEKENMSIATTAKLFSWPYLRELFKFPLLVCKALDLIENGLRMNTADWQSLSEKSSKLEQGGNIVISDESSSRGAFYDVFPVSGFTPLREMVKAARGFLLTHSSVLFGGSTYGSPLVPGSPLAISAALTAWVKRVIALLYISGTQRVRSLKSSSGTRELNTTENDLAANKLRPKTPQQLMAPPSLSFRCLVDSALSADQQQANLTMMYFAASCSLIKPADQLEVLLLSSSSSFESSQQNYGMNDQSMTAEALRSELESFLRFTSASPLHRVSIFSRAVDVVSEDPIMQEENILAASMHPAVRTENEGQKFEVLVMPLFSVNGVEPFIDGSRLLTEGQHKLIRSVIFTFFRLYIF